MGLFDSPVDFIFPGSSAAVDQIGNAWGSFTGKDQQQAANEANIQMAREQMAFQERMSSSAHQREVKDLEAAGINPILSAKLGGASSPSGAMAQVAPIPSATQKFVSTAMDVGRFARDQQVARQNVAESQSREDLNRATALQTGVKAEVDKAGWTGKVFGTDIGNFLRGVLQRAKHSADKLHVSPEKEIQKYMDRFRQNRLRGKKRTLDFFNRR